MFHVWFGLERDMWTTLRLIKENTVIDKRILSVLESNIEFRRSGKPDEAVNEQIRSPWFRRLAKAAPWVIYKRNTTADWVQFSEIFGMPIREYTYETDDADARRRTEEDAQNTGSCAVLIHSKDSTLELKESGNKTGSADLCERLCERCNSEISNPSICILLNLPRKGQMVKWIMNGFFIQLQRKSDVSATTYAIRKVCPHDTSLIRHKVATYFLFNKKMTLNELTRLLTQKRKELDTLMRRKLPVKVGAMAKSHYQDNIRVHQGFRNGNSSAKAANWTNRSGK